MCIVPGTGFVPDFFADFFIAHCIDPCHPVLCVARLRVFASRDEYNIVRLCKEVTVLHTRLGRIWVSLMDIIRDHPWLFRNKICLDVIHRRFMMLGGKEQVFFAQIFSLDHLYSAISQPQQNRRNIHLACKFAFVDRIANASKADQMSS